MNGIERIAAERKRQIEIEGWDTNHDQQHTYGELRIAAACYATEGTDAWVSLGVYDPDDDGWPWHEKLDKRKKHSRIRQLEIAGALIAAEIDRILAEQ